MQLEEMKESLAKYARKFNEGIILSSNEISFIKQISILPDNYILMMSISNGISFKRCTLLEYYEEDERGFVFGEFFQWEETVRMNLTLNEVLNEYNMFLPYEGLLYIGSTAEDKGILLGTKNETFDKVFIFSPTQMLEHDNTDTLPIFLLTNSFEEFILKLEPEPIIEE